MIARKDPGQSHRPRLFLFYWFTVCLYCLAIFLQSAFPTPDTISTWQWPGVDKVLHAGGYAVLAILFFRAYRETVPGAGLKRVTLISTLFATTYGISDEVHQYFVPMRTTEMLDILADFIGSSAGASAFAITRLISKKSG